MPAETITDNSAQFTAVISNSASNVISNATTLTGFGAYMNGPEPYMPTQGGDKPLR
jgi:hypothetical protein